MARNCTRSHEEEALAARVMSKLDGLPANLGISFFCLIHDMGFAGDDRDKLTSAVRRLAREGRVLMPRSDGDVALPTPLRSSRLRTGSSSRSDAIAIFGDPLSAAIVEGATILTYPLTPRRPGTALPTSGERTLIGFRLHFDVDGLLARIENFEGPAVVTSA